jgi:sulfide dehydrogenase cytochrome subunit
MICFKTRYFRKTATAWLIALTTATLASSSLAQSVAVSSEMLANCVDCHGSDGIAKEPDMPHLNGQIEGLLITMLKAYSDGTRRPHVPAHRSIPSENIAPIAKHYASQKANRPKSPTNPDLVTRGEVLYTDRCASCHLDSGRDSDKEAPLLAAQNLQYLIEQSLYFKKGDRKFPYLMDDAYKNLSDDDLAALAHYFAAQEQVAPKSGKRRR